MTGTEIQIEREQLQAIFDLAVGSMDFGSGFWETKDALAARKVAELLGLDPMEGTPYAMSKHFGHPFNPWPPAACDRPCCAAAAQVYAHRCRHCSDPADAVQHTSPIGYLGKVLDG